MIQNRFISKRNEMPLIISRSTGLKRYLTQNYDIGLLTLSRFLLWQAHTIHIIQSFLYVTLNLKKKNEFYCFLIPRIFLQLCEQCFRMHEKLREMLVMRVLLKFKLIESKWD